MYRLIVLFWLITLCLTGCTSGSESTNNADEVRQNVVIGHVDAETLFLKNIQDRIKMVLDAKRSAVNIFYHPSLNELILLEYVSLQREIKKVGLAQPGMSIKREDKAKLALELTQEKWDRIHAGIEQGVELDTLAEKFDFTISDDTDKIIKGSVPDWEKVLVETEIGKVSNLVIGELEQAYFFKVHGRGKNEDGEEWIETTVMYFDIPLTQARNILADRLSEKWNIRLTNGFYKSLIEYFSCEPELAIESLNTYLLKAGKNDSLAHYFKAHIILMGLERSDDQVMQKNIMDSLNKAISTCKDKKMKARIMYELASQYKESGEQDKSQEQLRMIFDDLSPDYALQKELKSDFAMMGDDEYAEKASKRLLSLEEQLKIEILDSERAVPRKSKIREGEEGYLHEDVDEILDEVENAGLREQECYSK